MILNWTSPAFLQWRPLLVPTTTACFASSKTLNTDQLRQQLDHLHKEADKTRAKANNARLRLLRLSEAADKLRRQAAISVQSGKEDDAREMLIQKKKVMQALEKSKNRIELLDELAAKLNEAITMRETQLIGNVSLDLEVEAEDIPSAVRIVSPKETDCNDSDGNRVHAQDAVEVSNAQELQYLDHSVADLEADNQLNNNEEASASGNAWNEADRVDSLKGISSYEDFLEHIDLKLKTIEDELVTVLRFSGLVIESKEKLENSKIQQLLEIFDSVHRVRESAKRHPPQKYFNVLDYGAVADGKSENSPAFLKAWEDACRYPGKSRVLIPKGTFKIWSTTFSGPCNGPISFVIKGVVKAPVNPGEFMNMDTWLGFRYLDRLSVNGGGYLDGQGQAAWPHNDCSTNPNCSPLPVSLRFDFVNNAKINHLRSINSKNTHFNLFACNNVNISRVRLTAPGDSPNTDGIRIGASTNVKITTSLIQTGDDCVAMVTGAKNIVVSNVTCGPGHGISIGSLGKSRGEFVSDVKVINCTFIGTQNGARIKTWAAGSMPSTVSNVFFGYINMQHVNNPILIDQTYCPGLPFCSDLGKHSSLVQIKDVTFYNIWGTSSSKVAVALKCSAKEPCQNIILNNIYLSYDGRGGPAISECSNVNGRSYGRQYPHSCL